MTQTAFTHAQHKLMLSSPDQSCQNPAETHVLTVTRKHASHEALFKGSFCTVMAQMFTPLAFHVTTSNKQNFTRGNDKKNSESGKINQRTCCSSAKVDVYACLKCKPYHISINDIYNVFDSNLTEHLHKAMKSKHVIVTNKTNHHTR